MLQNNMFKMRALYIYEQYENTRKISEDMRTELLNRENKKKLKHCRNTVPETLKTNKNQFNKEAD